MKDNRDNISYKKEVISNLKFGDCIYANRCINEAQERKFGVRHTTGPFVVLGISNGIIKAFYCTSKEYSLDNMQIGEDYRLFSTEKNTYVNIYKIQDIDENHFYEKIDETLTESDYKRLKKKVFLQKYEHYRKSNTIMKYEDDLQIDYDVLDVVADDNSTYVIVNIDGDNYKLIPIENYDPRHSHIDFKRTSIDYDITIIKSKDEFYYVNSISELEGRIILDNYYKKNSKTDSTHRIIKSKKDYTDITKGQIVCLKNDSNSKYIIRGKDKNVYKVISIKPLIIEDKVVGLKLHKSLIRIVTNISSKEIETINKHLINTGNEDLITNKRQSI